MSSHAFVPLKERRARQEKERLERIRRARAQRHGGASASAAGAAGGDEGVVDLGLQAAQKAAAQIASRLTGQKRARDESGKEADAVVAGPRGKKTLLQQAMEMKEAESHLTDLERRRKR